MTARVSADNEPGKVRFFLAPGGGRLFALCAMFRPLLPSAEMRTMNRATMSDFRLDNYLWMYRKRAAFSQVYIASLLGVESATEMSRREKGRRLPSLDTALAYEVILGASSRRTLRQQARAAGTEHCSGRRSA